MSHCIIPVSFPTKLETIVRLDMSIVVPPLPIKIAITKISYLDVSELLQPSNIHKHPPLTKWKIIGFKLKCEIQLLLIINVWQFSVTYQFLLHTTEQMTP